MTEAQRSRLVTLLAAAACWITACPAGAQMTPLVDGRKLEATASYQLVLDEQSATPPGFFAYWEQFLEADAFLPEEGHTVSDAYQISEFYPAAIYGSGTTAGNWQGDPSGHYDAKSLMHFRFRLDYTVDYMLDATIDAGSGDPSSVTYIELRNAFGLGAYQHVDNGHVSVTGRLSPGEYVIEGLSSIDSPALDTQGGTYSISFFVFPVTSPPPLIVTQPRDTSTACGQTARFTVVPSTPSGTTYQWRRNFLPLSNNGHVTGVSTATLAIDNACDADTGFYDVVLTNGSIVEPSRLAHLKKAGTSDVLIGLVPASVLFTLGPPTPNPSRATTSFHYAAPGALLARAAIYDAAGRRVRSLANRVLSGSGALTWDGNTESGSPAPRGLYFLRVDVAGQAYVQRVARIE